MRVNDIITEAPAGMFKQGLKKFGAAALGALGAKNAASSLSTSANQGDRANAYRKEFDSFMSKKGLNSADADYADLSDFITAMGLPKPNIPTSGPIDTSNIDTVFTSIAKMPSGASTAPKQPASSGVAKPQTPTQSSANTGTAPATQPATTKPNLDVPTYQRQGKVIPGVNAPAKPVVKAKPTATQSADPFNTYKGQIRQLQSTGTKPLPEKMVASLNADMAKLAKGDKDSGVYAADKIIKFAKAGYDVSKLQQQWQGMAKAGERFLTQSIYREITAMLAEHGLRWSDLGLRVRIVESVSDGVFISYKPSAGSLDFVF